MSRFNHGILLGCLTVSVLLLSTPERVQGGDHDCDTCPCKHGDKGEEPDNEDQSANDPAFVMTDPVRRSLQEQRKALLELQRGDSGKSAAAIAAEQARYQKFREAVKATPASAYLHALGVWKEGVDANLQRLVILDALPVVRSSEEGEALRWMLNALDNLEKERAECIRLAKGNSLEKSLAVKRLELLDGNPRLRSAMR